MSAWLPHGAGAQPQAFPPALSGALPTMSLAPEAMLELQQDYARRLAQLWTDFAAHGGEPAGPIDDARFADAAWQSNPIASFTARAYLLNSEFLNKMADRVEADDKTRRRVKFAVQQWVEAASPSNFLALNPKAQKRALETKGESLKTGLDNLLKDVAKGKISQTDESAFEVGRNVATTEGQVVYENDLIQLIQYAPLTEKVRTRPFVIVPPCINKFYILDLQPENSFVRYCVSQGNTVFVVSWKNPHEAESTMTWDDYIELGPIAAFHIARDITGADKLNVLGFCVGGTIVATALAVLAARGEDIAASLTLLTALIDFTDSGVLDIFIDEAHVRLRERTLGKGGLMPGKDLANTFSSLRPNDLVWNYVVANYLEGRSPPAFDLLYWNGDSTNLPGPMYAWYLRNTYLENNLKVPNKLTVCGQKIDLRRVKVPAYVFAAREDHIVPWKAAYASARCLPGDRAGSVKFVLGASGHIAGTINPASKNKRSYWIDAKAGAGGGLPADAESWLQSAQEKPGSWWNDWDPWLARFAGGEKIAPKHFGNTRHPPIEPAPGRYVKEKA
jgi:polyhydroxyalkanoate synthase